MKIMIFTSGFILLLSSLLYSVYETGSLLLITNVLLFNLIVVVYETRKGAEDDENGKA